MATSKRKTARNPKGIDLDAVICLDMSHQWRLVEEYYSNKGILTGCPRRAKLCMVCGSMKIETINWRGYIISREYKSDRNYIENARKLAETPNERRAEYRKMLLGRPPKDACDRCGLVHDSVDCPDMF